MVTQAKLRVLAALVVAIPALPAAADGILEQMQSEVAAIATKSRSAVVSIEEVRPGVAAQGASTSHWLQQAKIATELTQLNVKKVDLDARIVEINTRVAPRHPALVLMQEERTALEARIAALQNQVDPDAQWKIQEITFATQFTELMKQQTDMEVHIAELGQKLADNHPRLRTARARKDALETQIATLCAQRQQQLNNTPAQTVRQDMPKSGSGFSIGNGYIVTTSDVLNGMKHPTVVTDDGTRVRATIVGVDTELNVGLLKLAAKFDLPALRLGDSAKVAVGHFGISIGNQTGQTNSVALNLVSGIRKEGISASPHFYPSLLQIAGTVSAGSSGAPLLNARGEVIGMIVAIPEDDWVTPTSNFNSFFNGWQPWANPPNPFLNANRDLLTPSPNAPGKGLSRKKTPLAPPEEETAPPQTAVVPFNVDFLPRYRAQETSPAACPGGLFHPQQATRAGIPSSTPQSDPRNPSNPSSREYAFRLRSAVTGAGFALPINDMSPLLDSLRVGNPIRHVWIGTQLDDQTREVEQDGIVRRERTVKITGIYPDSPALRDGLQPEDLLMSLNGTPMRSSDEARAVILRLRPGETVALVVKRGNNTQTVNVKVEARPTVIKEKPITAPANGTKR